MSGTDSEPQGITIGLREVYDQVVGVREDVRDLKQNHESVNRTLADQEERIRSLERWKYALPPALLIAIATSAVAVLRTAG
ncbi:hypothetical protein [Streptomyces sp. NPDC045470]|uniref:hypothetical protein n=1 Tax=Streptomyces sp. NPDC045470 TaxID=3155469 RepID=UPI0033F4583A